MLVHYAVLVGVVFAVNLLPAFGCQPNTEEQRRAGPDSRHQRDRGGGSTSGTNDKTGQPEQGQHRTYHVRITAAPMTDSAMTGLAMRRSASGTLSRPTPRRDRRQSHRRLRVDRACARAHFRDGLVRHRLGTVAATVPAHPRPGRCPRSPSDAAPQLAEILGHPSVVLGELDAATAAQVDQLLFAADVFDACAGHIVHIARSRGWPVLTDDPERSVGV